MYFRLIPYCWNGAYTYMINPVNYKRPYIFALPFGHIISSVIIFPHYSVDQHQHEACVTSGLRLINQNLFLIPIMRKR